MASNVNLTKGTCQTHKSLTPFDETSKPSNFEAPDKPTNTLKRNQKMELGPADALQLLSYLEGELQARDIVIATLKCEKMKYLLSQSQHKPTSLSDPMSALHRDGFAAPTRSTEQSDLSVVENQRNYLENLILQHRKAQIRMANILKDAEIRHRKVIEELILEKKKHEHDTAQGDDITYGLEKERTRLKQIERNLTQDLELERQAKKRLEKDLKKISDVSDEDKNRQKQIVLLLLAERKKIVMKYIEERKRSEDLAQILSEEKSRIDSMAEGLEEESKKSLQMEAELEKQLAQFDTESQILKSTLNQKEKRVKELEIEVEKLKEENMMHEKQLAEFHQMAMQGTLPNVLTRSSAQNVRLTSSPGRTETSSNASSPVQNSTVLGTSVAKIVQPTATVSSVPVSGPTTGVARSISPGHGLRGIPFSQPQLRPNFPAIGKVENRAAAPTVKPVLAPNQKPPAQNFGTANGNSEKKQALPRGVPPPVPPNKPIVPPKKDSVRRPPDANSSLTAVNKETKASTTTTTTGASPPVEVAPTSAEQSSQDTTGSETYQNVPSSSQTGVV